MLPCIVHHLDLTSNVLVHPKLNDSNACNVILFILILQHRHWPDWHARATLVCHQFASFTELLVTSCSESLYLIYTTPYMEGPYSPMILKFPYVCISLADMVRSCFQAEPTHSKSEYVILELVWCLKGLHLNVVADHNES